MCRYCRAALKRLYRDGVPTWAEDCGYEVCDYCGNTYIPEDNEQANRQACRSCEAEYRANTMPEDTK